MQLTNFISLVLSCFIFFSFYVHVHVIWWLKCTISSMVTVFNMNAVTRHSHCPEFFFISFNYISLTFVQSLATLLHVPCSSVFSPSEFIQPVIL
jgi:hypothetical protein